MKKTITIKSSNGGPARTVRLKYNPVMLRLMGGTYAREVDRLCKPLTGISTNANGTASRGCRRHSDRRGKSLCAG